MADAFPDKKYIFIDGVVEKANVASVTFAEQEAGYLAGYAAALQSKTGKVGFIGGAKNSYSSKIWNWIRTRCKSSK